MRELFLPDITPAAKNEIQPDEGTSQNLEEAMM
jgi:hypothetical protein